MKLFVYFLLLVAFVVTINAAPAADAEADPEPLFLKKKIKKIVKAVGKGLKKVGGGGGGFKSGGGGFKYGGGGGALLATPALFSFKSQPIGYAPPQPAYVAPAPEYIGQAEPIQFAPAPPPAAPIQQCQDRTFYETETVTLPPITHERTVRVQGPVQFRTVAVPTVHVETVTTTEFFQQNIERTTTSTIHQTEYISVPVTVVQTVHQTQYRTNVVTDTAYETIFSTMTKTAKVVTTSYYEVPQIQTVVQTHYSVVSPVYVSSTVNKYW